MRSMERDASLTRDVAEEELSEPYNEIAEQVLVSTID